MAKLHYRLISGDSGTGAAPARVVVFLHGILGSGRNWASVARRVVSDRPEWTAAVVDLRMHGDSRGFAPPHTVAAAASDVLALLSDHHPRDAVIVGHSFGGKVALECASRWTGPLRQVWVMDANPAARLARTSAARMIDTLGRLPDSFADRDDLIRSLRDEGFPEAVASWMATNLAPRDDGLRWRFSLPAIREMLADFATRDLWPIVDDEARSAELHFVRATRSEYIVGVDHERLAATARDGHRVFLHDVEGGHWLNVDNPDALVDLLDTWLP